MKVKNFSGFMRSKLNESMGEEYDEMGMGMYGANPEDADAADEDADAADEDGADEEPLTLEDLKAMIDELTERVEALEGGGDEEGSDEEGSDEEGSDEEEPAANESWRFNKSRRYKRY
jgi:hypothetical protein